MGVLTNAGRAAMVRAVKEQSIYLALGTGDNEWGDTPPLEDVESTGLINEIGRRALARSLYVTPDDENGTLEVPTSVTTDTNGTVNVTTQKYSVSETPTRHLYLEFALDFADAANITIRELGVYIGCRLRADVEPGRLFFTRSDFSDEGLLFQIENREPLLRKPDTRDTFTWVISI